MGALNTFSKAFECSTSKISFSTFSKKPTVFEEFGILKPKNMELKGRQFNNLEIFYTIRKVRF